VIVIDLVIVIVAALVNGNDAVAVIDTVDEDATALGSGRHRLQCCTSKSSMSISARSSSLW
jgi:hypothetical protein